MGDKNMGIEKNQTIMLIGIAKILEVTALSRTEFWRLRRDGKFPEGFTVDGGRKKRWRLSVVNQWMMENTGGCNV